MKNRPNYRIYRNLHHRNWTIQHYVQGKGWRKLQGARVLYAPSVDFQVSIAGRERVVREGRKNVHAYALVDEYVSYDTLGQALGDNPFLDEWASTPVIYNPYAGPSFRRLGGQPVDRIADPVLFDRDGRIWAP